MDRAAHALGRCARRDRGPLGAGARGGTVLAAFFRPSSTRLFAIGVAWGIGRPILASNQRNWFFILLVLALGAASVAFQAYPQVALAAGLDVVLLVIAIMGGRVIPGFTNNAVIGAGARRNKWIQHGALGSVLLILVLDLFVLGLAGCAGRPAIHAARLALWAPLATRGRPILWICLSCRTWMAWCTWHCAAAGLDLVNPALATHALTVGVIGGLTLGGDAHFARAPRGRCRWARGKPLRTSWCTWPRSPGCCCPSCSAILRRADRALRLSLGRGIRHLHTGLLPDPLAPADRRQPG